jgi:hypothetical protein
MLALATALLTGVAHAERLELDAEAGVAYVSRNSVRIPGNSGTSFSLVDDLNTPAAPVGRLRGTWRPHERHELSALYAPLQVNATGTAPRDIRFAGGEFQRGTPLLAVYKFNSYRLTYRYALVKRPELALQVGLTGKIRDAEIALYGDEAARKTDLGFVPLLHLRLDWRPRTSRIGLLIEADALASPQGQGRAEDLLIAATWAARPGVRFRVGYRTVEGGADVTEVYNFAWIHYAVGGVTLSF